MIITCPNCGTQYSVDGAGFGRAAKNVRCFNCNNQWLQHPVVVPPVAPQQQPVMPNYHQPPPQMPGAYAGYPPPPGYPPGYPPPGYPPPGYPPVDGTPPQEAPPAPMEEGGIPGEITPAEDPDLSDDDLESLFDEDEAANGISSMVEPSAEDGGDDDLDDDDAPASRRGRKKKPKKKKKGGMGLIIAIILILLLGGTGAGMFFMRGMVLQYVPALAMVYDMVGLGAVLGDGLEIRNVNSERGTGEGGIDFLMLSGNVTNIAEEAKPVPLIKAILIDANDEVIQAVVQEPDSAELPAGEVMGFAIKIEEPSPLARRLEVTFEPRPQPE